WETREVILNAISQINPAAHDTRPLTARRSADDEPTVMMHRLLAILNEKACGCLSKDGMLQEVVRLASEALAEAGKGGKPRPASVSADLSPPLRMSRFAECPAPTAVQSRRCSVTGVGASFRIDGPGNKFPAQGRKRRDVGSERERVPMRKSARRLLLAAESLI